MARQNEEPHEDTQVDEAADPWAAAFAALEHKGEEGPAPAPDESDRDGGDAAGDGGQGAAASEADDGIGLAGDDGQLGRPGDGVPEPDGGAGADLPDVSEEEIQAWRERRQEELGDQAIKEVAEDFVRRGARNQNGRLGASINDPDICKRDQDGVPSFYNPDTGRRFTGENPRRQAQEWVDDYNAELARQFNETCQQWVSKASEQDEPMLRTLEFAPTYKALDPIRRQMLDDAIEDYAVDDEDGNVIGYSCDLNRALEMVNRQVAGIQAYGKAHMPASEPALDMKATGSAQQGRPKFKSLAEALEWEQDQQLGKLKGRN